MPTNQELFTLLKETLSTSRTKRVSDALIQEALETRTDNNDFVLESLNKVFPINAAWELVVLSCDMNWIQNMIATAKKADPQFSLNAIMRFAACIHFSEYSRHADLNLFQTIFNYYKNDFIAEFQTNPLLLLAIKHHHSLREYFRAREEWYLYRDEHKSYLAHRLVAANEVEGIKLLIALDTNNKIMKAPDIYGCSVAQAAVQDKKWDCLYPMLEADPTLFADEASLTIPAQLILAGQLPELLKRFKPELWIQVRNRVGQNLAHTMVEKDYLEGFNEVTRICPDLAREQDNNDNTCAHLLKSPEMLEAVLKFGNDLDVINKVHLSPPELAVAYPVVNRHLLIAMLVAMPKILILKMRGNETIRDLTDKLGWDFTELVNKLVNQWQTNIKAGIHSEIANEGIELLKRQGFAIGGVKQQRDELDETQDRKRARLVDAAEIRNTFFAGFAGGDAEFESVCSARSEFLGKSKNRG